MTRRQAAPAAQRWLVLLVALLVAPWLGQGVAAASGMSVDPQSGPPGTNVSVHLTDFRADCELYFDGSPVASVAGACDDVTLSFVVPDSPVGTHNLRAAGYGGGEVTEQTLGFRVTAGQASTTAPPTTAAPVDATPTTAAAQPATTAASTASSTPGAGGQPVTTAAVAGTPVSSSGAGAGGGTVFGAVCPPRQVALTRFIVAPPTGRPGNSLSAATQWGLVGTCTTVGALRVLFDGTPTTANPPTAGTSASFVIPVPDNAKAGAHELKLVRADDPSVVLATERIRVDVPDESLLPLVAAGAGGVLLLLILVLLLRRRRRRRRRARELPPEPLGLDADAGFYAPDLALPTTAVGPPTSELAVDDDPPTMPVVPLVVSSGRDGSYYLLERQNPHAPRTPNGKRGWYGVPRPGPVRGIVAHVVDPHTAGAAASELATGESPASAHVVVDVDGALELLPDDIMAIHRPELDDSVLVMLLAGYGVDPFTDNVILGHAAAWVAGKRVEHGIPARLLTPEEFEGGARGLVDDGGFPWPRIVTVGDPQAAPIEPPDITSGGADGAPLPGPWEVPGPLAGADDEPPPAVPVSPESRIAEAMSDLFFGPVGSPGDPDAPKSGAGTELPTESTPPPAGSASPAMAPAAPAPPAPGQPAPPTIAAGGPVAPSDADWASPAEPAPPTVSPAPPAPVPPPVSPPPADWASPTMAPSSVPVPEPRAPASPSRPPVGSQPAGVPPAPSRPPAPPSPSAPPFLPSASAAPPAAAAPAPPPAAEPDAPRVPRVRGGARALPGPDELIPAVLGTSAYYLIDHENPHATLRANGKHGWYYPTRYGGIRAVVLHSAGGGDSADEVAGFLADVDHPEALHAVVDPDSVVDLLPDDTTALHGVRSSSAALDLGLVYDPAAWGIDQGAEEALLVRAATWAGVRAVRHGVPVRRITVAQWHAGERGIAGNGDVDPGANFPWDRFLQLTAWVAGRVAAAQAQARPQPATDPSATVRSGTPPT